MHPRPPGNDNRAVNSHAPPPRTFAPSSAIQIRRGRSPASSSVATSACGPPLSRASPLQKLGRTHRGDPPLRHLRHVARAILYSEQRPQRLHLVSPPPPSPRSARVEWTVTLPRTFPVAGLRDSIVSRTFTIAIIARASRESARAAVRAPPRPRRLVEASAVTPSGSSSCGARCPRWPWGCRRGGRGPDHPVRSWARPQPPRDRPRAVLAHMPLSGAQRAPAAFDFGASASKSRSARAQIWPRADPTCSTAAAAATATPNAPGSALPMSSEAKITIRRTMNRGSSPPPDHREVVHATRRVRPAGGP